MFTKMTIVSSLNKVSLPKQVGGLGHATIPSEPARPQRYQKEEGQL